MDAGKVGAVVHRAVDPVETARLNCTYVLVAILHTVIELQHVHGSRMQLVPEVLRM